MRRQDQVNSLEAAYGALPQDFSSLKQVSNRSWIWDYQRSARIFHHHAFAKEEQTAEVNGDRLVRRGRANRIRPPHGYAIYREFFEPFDPVDHGFSHADRRDLAAAASARKGLGINRQIPAAFGDIRGGFGSDTDHVRLLIAFMGCTHPDPPGTYRPLCGNRGPNCLAK